MALPRTCKQLLVIAVLVASVGLAFSRSGFAQVAGYQPSSPTVSPYLNLNRANFGGVNNYYALVRPQVQQQAFNVRERNLRSTQGREILSLQNEVQQGLAPTGVTGARSWFQVPGTRARFRDTSGYYPQPILPGRRR